MVGFDFGKVKEWWKERKFWEKGAVVGAGILAVVLFVLIIKLLVFPVMLPSGPAEEPEYEYHLNSFSVVFSGKTKGNLTATTRFNSTSKDYGGKVNMEFKKYFQHELDEYVLELDDVKSMGMGYWYISNTCLININYTTGLSKEKQDSLLQYLKSEFDSKWYVNRTSYSRRMVLF